MSREIYEFSPEQLIIQDPELAIDLNVSCSLPRFNSENVARRQLDAEGRCVALFLSEGRVRHGECHLFSEDGSLRSTLFYLEGRLHGPCETYGPSGALLSKSWYCEGKRWGKAHFYSLGGAVVSCQRFKAGVWHGVQEYFYEAGGVKSLIPFEEGKLQGCVRLFWEGNQLKREVHHERGAREGSDRLWNERGLLIDEGTYAAGQPVGVHRHYFTNGLLKEERVYHTPIRFDCKQWDPSSRCILEGVFAPDLCYTERRYLEGGEVSERKGVWRGNRIHWS
jgi:antitoxin component YwqK of YwqJK toxin-antitoxin module